MNEDFVNSLTLDEVETIENLTGIPMDQILSKGTLKGKALKVVYWVVKRRDEPELKFENIGKISLGDALEVFEVKEDPKG